MHGLALFAGEIAGRTARQEKESAAKSLAWGDCDRDNLDEQS